ncbi:hypothetical protein BMS3Abin03_01835 [bacterium BMS3Abin03]|nr:hypothetical protein BMS3Abin03_01835 [bacterium BMS3Abin03]
MKGKNYTAIVKRDDDWWIGWIEEVPGVNCQEQTREELIESLKQTLLEALEFTSQDLQGFRDKTF